MLLHTINQSPFSSLSLKSCEKFSIVGDAVVFLENGVYALVHPNLKLLIQADLKLFALQADILARGLQQRCPDTVKIISYLQFVELCVQYPKQKAW